MSKQIRIGTRDSELAMWQARTVQSLLEANGHQTLLVPVKSQGDLNLDEPLYEMGITGIFTKTLDVALVKGEIDIAVHSLKDVPTQLPKGMIQAAVLPRADHRDILVFKKNFNPDDQMTIATGSLRRKSQWLDMYPQHKVVDLRGNVNTRLAKLQNNEDWNAAIFAKAGLERINILQNLRGNYGLEYSNLDSFIPAPAQGAMMIACMQKNEAIVKATAALNDLETQKCVDVERLFLRRLEGGCTAPIGAFASIHNDSMHFQGCLLSLDGSQRISANGTIDSLDWKDLENFAFAKAEHILNNGGTELMTSIKQSLQQ
ncbi:hydroxymethylbilane synthase [Nonlabens ponticola]|uniref:Hydroxymethylbilane synthase n=1 Tax=Nonlabens ponticola TaxID=2496866 RepID=A0A3S9MV83_9FLAO|nr:hydroxymethylbilane synthase [Nonlabens ponticola]AZQ43063.1 hydroxymethylbilane synthase [Nonlabens ponticola]